MWRFLLRWRNLGVNRFWRVYRSPLNPASRSEPENRKICFFSTIHNWLPSPSLRKNIIPMTSNVTWNPEMSGGWAVVPGSLDLTHPSYLPPGGSHADSRLYTLRDQESYLDGPPTRPSSEGAIVFSVLLQPSLLTISRFITLLYPHFTCKLIPKGNVSIFWTLVQTEILFLLHYYRDFFKGQIQSQNSLD